MTTPLTAQRGRRTRELPPAVAFILLLVAVAIIAPSFFSGANLRDLALNNAPVLIVAIGMTLVILIGEIDISVGSQFALCSVAAGSLAKAGVPMSLLPPCVIAIGVVMGALNGLLVGALGLPSIIVTLAMLVAWRDGLRWQTEGAWVQNLPADFQWLGLSPSSAYWVIVLTSITITVAAGWMLRHLRIGRAIYTVGSDAEAARLAGIEPPRVVVGVFAVMGALVGLAALLNAVRFNEVPSNAGTGLELKVIAAVVVGGGVITGGRGTPFGTFIGVALLGTIGTALSYVGINPFWEKAVQGAIILAALAADVALARLAKHHRPPRKAIVAAP